MNLWPVEHFCAPFFSRSLLIWKITGDKSVQLVRNSFLSKYFLQNPYFSYPFLVVEGVLLPYQEQTPIFYQQKTIRNAYNFINVHILRRSI